MLKKAPNILKNWLYQFDLKNHLDTAFFYAYSDKSLDDCLREIKNRLDSLPKNIRPSERDNYDALCEALKAYKGELKKK